MTFNQHLSVIDTLESEAKPSAVISVQNLVHRYGENTALDGVLFDVGHAELFGLLGPNGSDPRLMGHEHDGGSSLACRAVAH